jgi:hypothetical protein
VGVLFISHSSRDNAAAIRVCEWLKGNGWGEVYLDLDPAAGAPPASPKAKTLLGGLWS